MNSFPLLCKYAKNTTPSNDNATEEPRTKLTPDSSHNRPMGRSLTTTALNGGSSRVYLQFSYLVTDKLNKGRRKAVT